MAYDELTDEELQAERDTAEVTLEDIALEQTKRAISEDAVATARRVQACLDGYAALEDFGITVAADTQDGAWVRLVFVAAEDATAEKKALMLSAMRRAIVEHGAQQLSETETRQSEKNACAFLSALNGLLESVLEPAE